MKIIVTAGMGWLEVITGSMFSGKSSELINRLRMAKYAKQKVVAFKHSSDTRYDQEKLSSHDMVFIEAVPVTSIKEMEKIFLKNIQIVR